VTPISFHNIHEGETCLLVGNGKNLSLTPPELFNFPSFGMNTIHLYDGWKPTYYCTVDQRVMREFGDAIFEKFSEIPKFFPQPNLNKWSGENVFRFLHRPGELLANNPGDEDFFNRGLAYTNITHVAIQLAWHMGFTTMLIIGMEHKLFKGQDHFWGCDHKGNASPPLDIWFEGYQILVKAAVRKDIKILNISADTFVPIEVIPQGNYRNWITNGKN